MIRLHLRAFTLVELLVVISIIAVLVSILLPAISGAMARSRELKCLANCQQMGLALHAYALDSHSYFPVMATPSAPPQSQQYRYGGLAGLFSLSQVGDGTHTGFTGGAYSDGSQRPLLEGYVGSLGTLTCPSDREDRYYGDPYSPSGNTSYSAATPLRPRHCGKAQDVVAYNISYLYFTGLKLETAAPFALWGDESNGPDLDGLAWYGDGSTPLGGTTPNSIAAGAAAVGRYAPVDNHTVLGGNFVYSDGHAKFRGGAQTFTPPARAGAID